MKIYAFGNEFVESDSLAKEISSSLIFRGYDVVFAKTPDVLFGEKKAIIIDVAKGISAPILIDKVSMLKTSAVFSLHDFDLANYLKIITELHNFKFRLIAIPQQGNKENVFAKVLSMLDNLKDF